MIPCQTIIDKVNALLDAEGSQRYEFDLDFKPAINQAIDWATALFNTAFAQNKISPESLSELSVTKCWVPSELNRINFNSTSMTHKVWTILAVYPKCTYETAGPIPTSTSEAQLLTGVSFVDATHSAARLTHEQWHKRHKNPFVPGNIFVTCDEMVQYAYLDPSDYRGSYTLASPEKFEITISPDVVDEVVAITYCKYPSQVTSSSDNLEFPLSLTDMIVQKVCNYISFKEGDPSLNTNSEQELAQLIRMMNVKR